MHTIILAGLPPSVGSWLAYRLRGDTVELVFSPEEAVERLRGETAPCLVVLCEHGSPARLEKGVRLVRDACGPDLPLLVVLDAGEALVDPLAMAHLRHGHGVRQVVSAPAHREELLRAIEAALPHAVPPRPPAPAAPPLQPLRRFPDRPEVVVAALPAGGVRAFSAPDDDPLRPAPPRPRPALPPADPPTQVRRAARPVVLVASADARLQAAFRAGAGGEYEVRVSPVAALLAEPRPDAAVVLLDVGSGDDERAWRLVETVSRRLPRAAVIVAAAHDLLAYRVRAARMGVHAFVPRPVPPEIAREVLARAVPAAEPTAPRVLAVDADAEQLATVRALFENLGWDVHTLAEPLRFWTTLEGVQPDLLILDVETPEVNGLDLCRVVRTDPRWRGLPILFLTTSTDGQAVYRAFAAGADDLVPKPFWGPDLVSRVRNRLRRVERA